MYHTVQHFLLMPVSFSIVCNIGVKDARRCLDGEKSEPREADTVQKLIDASP